LILLIVNGDQDLEVLELLYRVSGRKRDRRILKKLKEINAKKPKEEARVLSALYVSYHLRGKNQGLRRN